jgi:hypothetical protein
MDALEVSVGVPMIDVDVPTVSVDASIVLVDVPTVSVDASIVLVDVLTVSVDASIVLVDIPTVSPVILPLLSVGVPVDVLGVWSSVPALVSLQGGMAAAPNTRWFCSHSCCHCAAEATWTGHTPGEAMTPPEW